MNIQEFEYPDEEESFVDSDDELNPFLFELDQHSNEMDRLEKLFSLSKDNSLIDVISDVNHNLKKLRKHALVIQKEHQMFQVLKKAYEDLKAKTKNHDAFVTTMMAGYDKQINELNNDLQQTQQINLQYSQQIEKQITMYKEQLNQKADAIKVKDVEINTLKEREIQLQNQVLTLSQEVQKLQKEVNAIKKIKTSNFLQLSDKSDFPYSTFELVVSTKIKNTLIQFLEPRDIVSLYLTKKSLYFALCQFKLIIPQVIKCKTITQAKEIKMLTKQQELFQRLISDCQEWQLKTQMIKIYELNINPNEFIDPTLNDATNFIKGTQFLSGIDPDNGESGKGLQQYLQQQARTAKDFVQLLKQQPFQLSEFTKALMIKAEDKNQYVNDRNQQIKNLRLKLSEVQEKLFTLGNAVSSDAGMYGTYLMKMQGIFASLYVYSSHLNSESKLQQCLIYYMAQQHWQLIEKVKILEQMNQDKTNRLSNNQNDIKGLQQYMFLYSEQIKSLQQIIKNQQTIMGQHGAVVAGIEQEALLVRQDLNETKQLLMNYGKNIKLLALEIRELRVKNKSLIKLHNDSVHVINNLKEEVNSIEI